jgi:hypothetical protein
MRQPIKHSGFDDKNYKWLYIGLAINILGYLLMIGGGAEDPSQFNGGELFSSTRITLSPILIVVGYIIIFYAIMKRPKKDDSTDLKA